MENFFHRYRNEWVLVAILFVQLIGLATQVRVPAAVNPLAESGDLPMVPPANGMRMIKVWAVATVSPFQRIAVFCSHGVRNFWSNYIDLRGVRRENEQLRHEVAELRFSKISVEQEAEQGRKLQALLSFKLQYVHQTVAAQVIGASGTELSRVIYVDRGRRDGIADGMAVITPDGLVGKISRADRSTSQVLLVNDPQSGAGVLLERLHANGILKGGTGYYPEMQNVMAEEKVQIGDRILTTGGDRIYPRGLPVGTVDRFSADKENDPFLYIRVKPAVDLGRLEEVLIVTSLGDQRNTGADSSVPLRPSDVLAERLPYVKKKTPEQIRSEEKIAAQAPGETVPQGLDASPSQQSTKPVAMPAKPTTGPAEIKPVVPNEKPSNLPPDQPR